MHDLIHADVVAWLQLFEAFNAGTEAETETEIDYEWVHNDILDQKPSLLSTALSTSRALSALWTRFGPPSSPSFIPSYSTPGSAQQLLRLI